MFAMSSVLDAPLPVAMFGAAVWSLGIFNLDRWLVSAIKRRPTFWGNVWAFLPRLFLAIILGLVISEPLVLRIFQPEIVKEVQTMAQADAAANEKALLKDPRYVGLPKMKEQIDVLQAQVDGAIDTSAVVKDPEVVALAEDLKVKEAALADAQQAVNCEVEGRTDCAQSTVDGSGKVGWGPAAGEKVKTRDDAKVARDAAKTALDNKKAEVALRLGRSADTSRKSAAVELKSLRKEYKALVAQQQEDRDSFRGKNAESAGLLARMAALHELGQREATLAMSQWMLRLFIILIDAMPVLVKFLMTLFPPSLYERELERVEEEQDLEQAEAMLQRREIIRLDAEVVLHEETIKSEMKHDLAKEVAQAIVDAEREIAQEQITIWKNGVLDDIRANPGAYIIT
jgi:hypothetical protein